MRISFRLWPAILAGCSAAILVVGARLDVGKPANPVPSEATVLERRLESATGSEMGGLLYNRALRFASRLTWVPPAGASGVRWGSSDTVLTTTPTGTPPVQTISGGRGGTPVRDIFRGELPPGEWVVAVARTGDGRLVWTAGLYGGKTTRSCGGATFGELQLSAPLTDAFAGAALIDSNSRFVGMVVRCDGAVAAMSVDGIGRTLAAQEPEGLNQYGFRAAELAPELRARFDRRAQWIITAVRDGSVAAQSGLRPGDVLAEPVPNESGMLGLYRNRRIVQVRVVPLHGTVRGTEVESSDGGLKVISVSPDSAAGRAGMRAGDLIVRAGAAAGDPDRLYAQLEGGGTTFVVYHRADRSIGVFLP